MSYGIKVYGAAVGNWDGFVINSEIDSLRFLALVHTSTTAVTAGNTYPNYSAGDIVMARPSAGYGTIYTDFRNSVVSINYLV